MIRYLHLILIGLLLFLFVQAGYAQTEISGAIEGTLPVDEYLVVGNVRVEAGTSLHLQPGTILRFRNGVNFDLYGPLVAEGIEGDSIYFEPETDTGIWGGLNYYDFSGYHQSLRYCVITGSNSSGVRAAEFMTLYIKHCRFSYNSATQYGGAIAWNHWESGAIDSSEFSFNEDYAICFYNSGQGVSYSELNIHDNEGGVRILDGPVTLSHCRVVDNAGVEDGGGILNESNGVYIRYCLVKGNSATNRGGGIYSSGLAYFINCTIVWNTSGAYGAGFDNASWLSCINSIIAFNDGPFGIYYPWIAEGNCTLNNNLFYGNTNQDLGYVPSSGSGYGILNQVNSNGDSCDTHFNLFMDPLFANDETNFQILPDSPCIDAGDPSQPYDPDGSIADIGAFPTGTTGVFEPDQRPSILESIKLFANYPNPFNNNTSIPFVLPEAEHVDLVIYNSLGQQVAHLVHGMQLPGSHLVAWDGRNDDGQPMGSGLYIVSLQTPHSLVTRKTVMVK